jgi:hypothetical protein
MCRSIKVLRVTDHQPGDSEIYEAALQFVQKISGYRKPSQSSAAAFERAVAEVATASRSLLASLQYGKSPLAMQA